MYQKLFWGNLGIIQLFGNLLLRKCCELVLFLPLQSQLKSCLTLPPLHSHPTSLPSRSQKCRASSDFRIWKANMLLSLPKLLSLSPFPLANISSFFKNCSLSSISWARPFRKTCYLALYSTLFFSSVKASIKIHHYMFVCGLTVNFCFPRRL